MNVANHSGVIDATKNVSWNVTAISTKMKKLMMGKMYCTICDDYGHAAEDHKNSEYRTWLQEYLKLGVFDGETELWILRELALGNTLDEMGLPE